MTSSRGQNVSVLPRSDANSITVFTDAGGSLRSGTRKISLRPDRTGFRKEKNFGLQSNFSRNGSATTFQNKECSSVNKCSNALITNSVSSSSLLNSINRELSPVRWCDREVDGVYLGRSGWVQVQQRSLDDCKDVLCGENVGFSTLPSRKNYPELGPDIRLRERKECSRPLNLPLATNKRIIRDDYERSSKFIQEFESVSPPSITPIISPPPAFKDNGLDSEFSRQSIRESYLCKKSFSPRPEIDAGPDVSPSSLLERRNAFNSSSSSPVRNELKLQHLPNHPLHTKSFEDDRSYKTWRSKRLDSTPRFRSLDNEMRMANERNGSDSFRRSFGNKESVKEKDAGNEENASRHLLGLQSSSWEALNEQRLLSKAVSAINHQGNKRRNCTEDYWNSYRTRSSSLDSNSSSSNDSSTSSNSSRGSMNYKMSRKTDSKHSQQSKFENSFGRDCRHFNVKRSRSLQLSEKKSTNESVLLNNSLSENSWNPALLENSTFRIKTQNKDPFPQHFFNHVFVTVNNESIPVVASNGQSLRSLNKITKSAVEQKKLIMEAEKEARIISEFMNGTRSRAAARDLLMHRYFNQPEDENPTSLSEREKSQKAEKDFRFLAPNVSNNQNCLNKMCFEGGSCRKRSQLNPPMSDLGKYPTANHSKPSMSASSNSSQSSHQSGNFTSFHNYLNQRKVEQAENKERDKSHFVYSEHANDSRSKRKKQNSSFSLDRASQKAQKEKFSTFSCQKQKPNNFERRNNEKVKSEFANSPSAVSEIEKRNFKNNSFEENSLVSSSSSSDVCVNDFGAKFKKTKRVAGSSAFFKDYVLETNSKTVQERFRSRPGSAPESKGCLSKGIDKRSLSLPRSFLSERHKLNNSYQRTLPQLKQGHSEIPVEISGEHCLNLQGSKTAPTTPVHDLRYGKSMESLYQIPSYRSSCASLFGETPLFKSRRIIQESPPRKSEQFAGSSDEINASFLDKKLQKIPDGSSETILQKLKKNFSLKYLKRKEYLKDNPESFSHETEGENMEAICGANSLTFDLRAFRNDSDDISEQADGFVRKRSFEKRIFKNGKYDSHDSGIQMLNRGIIDSSESQDTDIQEDPDSPLVARRYEIRPKENFFKSKSENINHILTDKLRADFQRRIKNKKHTNGKAVKRSYSDCGDRRSLNWDFKNYGERLGFYSSPMRDSSGRTTWTSNSSETSTTLNRSENLSKPGLRRSLSQPLGLNDLPPFEGRRPSTLERFSSGENEKNPYQGHSEGEFLCDSESSVSSLCDRKETASSEGITVLAEAVWDHVAMESGELPFRAGDVIEVLNMQDRDWWWGVAKEHCGYFPSAFVRLCVSQEDTVEDCLAAMIKGKNPSKQLRRGKSISFLSNDQVRSRIIRELLKTERDFVKILHDIKDGYIVQCRQRTDMFTPAQITTIFSNLEDILAFQNKFLSDLEANIDKEFPFKSCVGEVFLNHSASFRIYSEYCNSHPMAIATLQELYQKYNYCKFFEMCRLKRNLVEIPLDGYLLTPVQRICKYPLQLGELLKYTKPDHPDYKNVQEALETMKSVATLINERKRKMESLEKLAAWQQKVEGWEGEDLIEISSQLIHQGDVVKITSGMWTTNITLFLFDHQIVYCRKDLLKKNVYIYKGRISLDESEVIDIPDGKCQQLGVNIKYGLRINNRSKDKWLVFCCRSNEDKSKWLEALAEERRVVAEDKERNLDLPPTAKQLAKMAARANKYPPCKLKGKNKFALDRDALLCPGHSGVSKSKSNKRIGMWFPFGRMIRNTKATPKPRASLHRFT